MPENDFERLLWPNTNAINVLDCDRRTMCRRRKKIEIKDEKSLHIANVIRTREIGECVTLSRPSKMFAFVSQSQHAQNVLYIFQVCTRQLSGKQREAQQCTRDKEIAHWFEPHEKKKDYVGINDDTAHRGRTIGRHTQHTHIVTDNLIEWNGINRMHRQDKTHGNWHIFVSRWEYVRDNKKQK